MHDRFHAVLIFAVLGVLLVAVLLGFVPEGRTGPLPGELPLDAPPGPEAGELPAGADAVLRFALVALAERGEEEAIVGGFDVPLVPGEPFSVPVDIGRPLPPVFDAFALTGTFGGHSYGRQAGVELLDFENQMTLRSSTPSRVGSRSRTYVEPSGDFQRPAFFTGVPVVTPSRFEATANLVVVLDPTVAARTRAGSREDWLTFFRAAAEREPVPDRWAVERAVAEVRPTVGGQRIPAKAFSDFGPFVNAALGAFYLGDPELSDRLSRRLEEDPALLARVRTAQDDVANSSWFPPYEDLAGLVLGAPRALERRGESLVSQFQLPPLRILRYADLERVREPVMESLEGILGREPTLLRFDMRYPEDLRDDLGLYVIRHDPPAEPPGAQRIWSRAREEYLGSLPRPIAFAVARSGWLAALLLLALVVAIAFSAIPRGGRAPAGEVVRRKTLPPVALLTGVVLAGWDVDLLPVVLFVPAFAWLRTDVPHPRLERVAIAVGLFSVAISAGMGEYAAAIHPSLGPLAYAWIFLLWLLAGRAASIPPPPREGSLRIFLVLVAAYSVVLVPGLPELPRKVVWPFLLAPAIPLAVFLLGRVRRASAPGPE